MSSEAKQQSVAPPTTKLKAGILGATGTVGQKFIQLLEKHPWFEVHALGASERSAGQAYQEAVSWKLATQLPEAVKQIPVRACKSSEFTGCDVIFSALDANVAGEIELEFASAGFRVFSNAKNHRQDPYVPIVVPYVNPDHLDIIHEQQKQLGYKKGYIVTNGNCSTIGLVVALKPLLDAFGLEKLFVVTMQAISGAGYPGVAAFDITDNVFPYISGEEPKMEDEPLKILGQVVDNKFVKRQIGISATCNRVNVIDGHTECVSIKFEKPNITPQQVSETLKSFRSHSQHLNLPSAPALPLVVFDSDVRPQPRLDRDISGGYAVTVGRIRTCPIFDVKLTLCSHNTVIGAAGCSIMTAELAYAKGLLS